jgi:hypothetical protein
MKLRGELSQTGTHLEDGWATVPSDQLELERPVALLVLARGVLKVTTGRLAEGT